MDAANGAPLLPNTREICVLTSERQKIDLLVGLLSDLRKF
jgi:hypothetical protein